MKSINLKTKKVKKPEKQKAERPNGIKKQTKKKKDMVSASEIFITDTTLCTICSCPYNVPPFDDWTQCSKCTSCNTNITKKHVYLTGDYNINLLNHSSNVNVQYFLNTLIQHDIILTISKSTRITNTASTLLDNIFTNNIHNCLLESGIIKTDITDHFPIFLITNNITDNHFALKSTIQMRQINENSLLHFRNLLSEKIDWDLILQSKEANRAYDLFLAQFCKYYDLAFPLKKIVINSKSLLSPWMTKGNTQKTWNVINQIIGKKRCSNNNLPQKLIIDGEMISNKETIVEKLNNYFLEVGPNLASKIPKNTTNFKSYIKPTNISMKEVSLNITEVRNAYNSLKNNKSAGIDQISVNVVKAIFDIIEPSLFHIFNLSIQSGIVPEKLKIAKISPIFKTGDNTIMSNYRPISVLPCFSKLLERIMYDRPNKYLTKNKILYNKQFGFKKKTFNGSCNNRFNKLYIRWVQ
ncbi:uncharacterized protein LOC136078429 [Hydra vulgaris]|uniref:Uncharacterized protein LOC136078429 n=1 Tax=Hydra vulgaris TaxID=6087 RepID=A0ABM4BML5_HYDVU